MLYTRKGDSGSSGLFGTKDRLPKYSPIYHALGTLDECNSLLGVCRAFVATHQQDTEQLDIAAMLVIQQETLFIIQAELAGAEKHLAPETITALEAAIEAVESRIENPHAFVVPGSNPLSALLDLARAVSRRAERAVLEAATEARPTNPNTGAYLNRLSSLLYALARYTGQASGKERSPSY